MKWITVNGQAITCIWDEDSDFDEVLDFFLKTPIGNGEKPNYFFNDDGCFILASNKPITRKTAKAYWEAI